MYVSRQFLDFGGVFHVPVRYRVPRPTHGWSGRDRNKKKGIIWEDGDWVSAGTLIVRQRGLNYFPGLNVSTKTNCCFCSTTLYYCASPRMADHSVSTLRRFQSDSNKRPKESDDFINKIFRTSRQQEADSCRLSNGQFPFFNECDNTSTLIIIVLLYEELKFHNLSTTINSRVY